MGFYIRKSVSVGPLRFNLSKSGVGVSAGVPGFRVGSGPRGNYVHMGRGGLYYRTSLDTPGPRSLTPPAPRSEPTNGDVGPMEEIESGCVLAMVDAPSTALLEEFNKKQKLWKVWPLIPVIGFFAFGASASIHHFAPLVTLALVILATWLIRQWDIMRTTTVLMYDLEDAAVQQYQKLHDAFDQLAQAGRVGHIGARGNVIDGRRHAGAGAIVNRRVIRPHKQPPKRLVTNIEVASLPVGRQTLHFLPDRLLIVDSAGVGAVGYSELRITNSTTRFIEEQGVPTDATVVGQTWKYVNKGGTPDRRFKNNYEIPIALYEEIHFSSPSGLNEVIQVSRRGVGEALDTARRELASAVAAKVAL